MKKIKESQKYTFERNNELTFYKQNILIFFHFSGANKQDEALECYGRAANLFKMAKKWNQAGQTFVTVATHHSKLGNKHDSATNYVDAANCYKKSEPKGS